VSSPPIAQVTRTAWFALTLVGLLAGSRAGATTSQEAPDPPLRVGAKADKLIERVAEVYRTTKSYRDSGVIIEYEKDGESERERVRFKTAFVRPDRFRFEWSEPWPINGTVRRVVWSNGKEVRTWWQIPLARDLDERGGSLDMAIAGATGVSHGAAHTIPVLLMSPSICGRTIRDLVRPRIERDAMFDERAVWIVAGLYAERYLMRVYVDKETLVIRRIDESQREDRCLLERTTTYSPELDPKVADSELEKGW
jgi:hypothetical protein